MQPANIQLSSLRDFKAPLFLDRFTEACKVYASSIALLHDDDAITYEELDRFANRIANHLSSSGANFERVGLCLDRSTTAIAAMIGVMRCGAAFVPLDPEYPAQRLQYMVEDAGIQTIICDPVHQNLFKSAAFQQKLNLVSPTDAAFDVASPQPLECKITGDQLAYLMYTSGSTGNPKGVEIQHSALATYCDADIDIYQLTPSDRTLQFSTLNFDIAIEEIFPPLLVGSTVVVRPSERSDSENELSSIVRRYEITALHLATAYWHEWVDLIAASGDRVPGSLRMVLATGEKVSPTHYQRWLSLCDHDLLWCNAYGPTETTVTATVFIPEQDWAGESMPIGKPLKGYTAHILDSQDHPLGVGDTGDLYIGGGALARGYLNLPEKTESVFRTVPLENMAGELVPTRIYKTGDLARWLPDGNIEFAGRIDHQIKLGSYRIEPGEIEFHIGSHPRALEALVSYDEVDGKKALIAYIAIGNENLTAAEVAEFLRDRMPTYMIPSRYCFCESFPKTINGKIDRRRLPAPATSTVPRTEQFGKPCNDLQHMLVDLWQTVLGVSDIGIHDDFFAIGGSSLLVTRVIAGIRRHHDIAIPVRDFFANPTIASISNLLAQRLNLDLPQVDQSISQDLRSRLPIIDPFYFPSGSENLFAVRYSPPSHSSDRPRPGVLICGADGHEYARAHRNLQQIAVQLSSAGFEVLRFDYSGCGNSSGENATATTNRWVREIFDAAEILHQRTPLASLSIMGVRLGATLAARAVDQYLDAGSVKHLILWDPVVSGARYLERLDQWHHDSLNQAKDYLIRRRSIVSQSYGIELDCKKRSSFQHLRLPQNLPARLPTTIVASRNYLDEEPIEFESEPTATIQTNDEIYWHDPRYNYAAFSSPEICKAILTALHPEALQFATSQLNGKA